MDEFFWEENFSSKTIKYIKIKIMANLIIIGMKFMIKQLTSIKKGITKNQHSLVF